MYLENSKSLSKYS